MRLKLICGVSMAAAMAELRDSLGEDAFILSSRTLSDGGIELTAALDPEAFKELQKPSLVSQIGASPQKPLHVWHDVDLTEAEDHDGQPNYRKIFLEKIAFRPLDLSADAPPCIVCGVPGSGKTLTIARLATRLALAGVSPLVMTTDIERAGALEQLAACTRILGLDLIAAENAEMVEKICRAKRGKTPILIDTGAIVPFDEMGIKKLHDFQKAAHGSMTLVHPAGEDASDTEETVAWFREAGVRTMIVSRTDCVRRLGGIVRGGLAGMPLSEFSTGSQLIGGLKELDATSLHELMLSKWKMSSGTPARKVMNHASPKQSNVMSRTGVETAIDVARMKTSSVTGAAALMKHIAAQGRA